MATIEDKTIPVEVHDVGPIKDFSFEAPPSGVVVIKGPMGAGKSTLIDTIEAATSGKGKPPIADGADRAEVRIGSLLLRVGKRSSHSGEMDFSIIDGRYSIADLIAPPYKNRDSKDEHAIKTLAQLAGNGDVSLFYDLVGDQAEFERLCPLEAEMAGSIDIVAHAAKVERTLQARAREQESLAEAANGKADAFSAGAREVDCKAPHDESALEAAHTEAVRKLSALEQRAEDSNKRLAEARAAQDALEDAEAEMKGPSVAHATTQLEQARELCHERLAIVNDLEAKLRTSREELARAESALRESETLLQSASNSEQALARFRSVVEAAKGTSAVPQEALEAARRAVAEARQARDQGLLIRKALADREQALEWRKKAGQHIKDAERLRKAASGTDDVLSGLVSRMGTKLFVERGRLMVNSERGKESFWDLSDGERSEIAVTIFATYVGANGLLALPQSFWEGLDWQGRRRIAEHMKRVGVLAWTAESDKDEAKAGPLRAEVYGE